MDLRVADMALAAGCSVSTVKTWVALWESRPRDPRVPSVSRVSVGGRPGYRVPAGEFGLWLRGEDVVRVIPAAPQEAQAA